MRTRSLLCALVVLWGCAGTSEPAVAAPPPSSAPPPGTAAPSTVVPARVSAVRVSAPACGYGGSAPAVSVFVDVETDVALSGVTLSFTLADSETGAARGASREPETLVIAPPEHALTDFSTQGALPFDGTLAAGTTTRLEYFAGLGDPPGGEATPFGGPLRVDVIVHTNQGDYAASCETATMWPSS